MKKICIFALAAIMLLALTVLMPGCGQSGKSATGGDSDKKISIVATVFPPYDFAREIAGDKADITMLLPPASESHSFEPTPKDIIGIQNCDVFIYVGGESDEWVNGVLESMDTGDMKIITLMDCVAAVPEEVVEGMEEEEAGTDANAEEKKAGAAKPDEPEYENPEYEEPEYDEHVWTSPKNAKLIVQKISDALCEADPANASAYQKNTAAYQIRLDELDAGFRAVAAGAQRKTIVFGDRFPFRYLADAYGLDYFAAFPGCSTETEPSAATVKFLIDKINAEKIPVVFHIELSNEKMANTISEATGAKVLLLHACHNISKDDFKSGVSYIDIMTQNIAAIREALN
ncbi:MAG: metal ABC transporter substrate-binding protein [Clostridiales Family XIII bacterium]|jgi:zinc transport system substrate-binding protein|nr:metal ABC transporter substrate-binding protein [Clostridiales Family XIII bacterium]